MTDTAGVQTLAATIAADERCAAIYVDASGTIRTWNREAETIFGYRADQAIGCRADLIVPESERGAHWEGFERAIKSNWPGACAWGAIEPLHSSGRQLALEVFLLGLQPSQTGSLGGVLALFRTASPYGPSC